MGLPTLLLLLTVAVVAVNSFIIPVSPAALDSQGNKPHNPPNVLVRTYSSRSSICQDLVSNWQEWGEGGQFTILIKAETAAVDPWKVEVELDNPVDSLKSYEGTVEEVSKTKFVVTANSYNSKIEAGASKTVTFHISHPKDKTPDLASLVINGGDKLICKEVAAAAATTTTTTTASPEVGTSTTAAATTAGSVTPAAASEVAPTVKPETTMPSTGKNVSSSSSSKRGVHVPWPDKVLGLYVILADDTEKGFENNADNWTPELFPWQQEAANVLFFTFIHPDTMEIPPSFKKLSASRGTGAPGAVPKDTVIIFAIGGYAYSLKPNPWSWLQSQEAAEKMAEKVATWPDLYNCDGIDLDLEEGAGSNSIAGPNMIHFIRKLRQLKPTMIISQPTYGYPQVQAETDVINASWDDKGESKDLADSAGLMVYEGTQSLDYVKNFVQGSKQWQGFPIKVNVPANGILLGAKGSASSANLLTLAEASIKEDYRGIMVWYASVKNGPHYAVSWDASIVDDSIDGYKKVMALFRQHMAG